ncbi:hypothetical protein FSP39_008145 [Pinctada imbricata]|uniref:G-protein coupled receptors family 1 profile domain-containing protein n=1 Tax=Pinctada imbricata TaxID=66713 RepID=A0AA89BX40_PINIB|nr:hypothetical protein FSP39_008145 [Pinctada imbricata]
MSLSAIFYIHILKKAWEFYRRFRPAQVSGVNAESNRIRAKQKAIKNGKVMGIVTLLFTICWLPPHIYQFWYGVEFEGKGSFNGIILLLGTFNCIINPFIYAWQKEDFRKEGKKHLKCCKRQQVEGRKDKHQKDAILKGSADKESPFLFGSIQDDSTKATAAISGDSSYDANPLDDNQIKQPEDLMAIPHVADK